MSDITIEITNTELTFSLQTPVIEIDFPYSLPGVGVPAGGEVGDVLTKTGSGDYITGWEAPGASVNFEIYPAGENLSAGRVVIIDSGQAWYFQNTDATHAGRAYGVTKVSALTGQDVTIQVAGVIQDAAFNFTADRSVWIGADGEIFDSQPIGGVLVQKAGVAVENKKMAIDFAIQILKN